MRKNGRGRTVEGFSVTDDEEDFGILRGITLVGLTRQTNDIEQSSNSGVP